MDKQNIETLYPLAPLQQAFLWHSLQASSQAGLLHIRCTLHGILTPELLHQAWEWVVKRHPTLRSSVHWQAIKQPLQVVARRVTLPWVHLDWRDLEDPQSALAAFLAEDCDRGFDLTQTPIMRLALIRLSETDYELIWSCHHLMLDGWSGVLVLNQVADCYETLRRGQSPEMTPAPTFQAYTRWLKQQDKTAAAAFWQKTLKGFTTPTPLPASPASHPSGPIRLSPHRSSLPHSPTLSLSAEKTSELQDFLRSHRLTLSTLMQGIWALLLHSYSGEPDVLFGVTVSGRQGDLAGVEAIVGLLINVLPVRAQVSTADMILTWLHTVQTQQVAASRYAYASPDQIQAWSELSGRLFDSLLVIENYPIQTAPIQTANSDQSLHIDNIQSGIVSTYGLTMIVKPGDVLTLMLCGDPQRFEGDILATLLNEFQSILNGIIDKPAGTLHEILPSREFSAVGHSPRVTSPLMSSPDLSRDRLEASFVTPRNPLELQLAQIWESVLGVRPLSVEASFFELGGDSLLAVQLFNQMQQQLNCVLPLATLFQAPNVRQFAALLSQEQPVSPWSSLVPIQPRGVRLPFFFHGGSADALTWARFSHLLGPDQPFYALQRPDLDGSEVTHTTVETLATECVKEMRMVQPRGPYLIGGHCFGGAVAFEIAQQLQAEGEEIASVILIDAYRPEILPDTPLVRLQTQGQLGVFWLRKNYYYHGGWENLTQLPGKVWQRVKPKQPSPPEPNPVAVHLAHTPPPGEVSLLPYEYRYARAQAANELAADRYLAQPYSGRVKLFRANIQTLAWYFGRELGWQTVAKDTIETTIIPGFFGNLFNQRSGPLLAEQVKTYLSTLKQTKNTSKPHP